MVLHSIWYKISLMLNLSIKIIKNQNKSLLVYIYLNTCIKSVIYKCNVPIKTLISLHAHTINKHCIILDWKQIKYYNSVYCRIHHCTSLGLMFMDWISHIYPFKMILWNMFCNHWIISKQLSMISSYPWSFMKKNSWMHSTSLSWV